MPGQTQFTAGMGITTSGDEALNRLAENFGKLSNSIDGATQKASKLNEHPGFNAFADKIKQGIENPLGAAGAAAESFLKTLGPMGTAAAGAGTILASTGVAAMGAAKYLGDYAHEIEDASIKTGLATKEVTAFSFAARMNNQDIGIFERSMRLLSQAIEDGGGKGKDAREALKSLGVQYQDLDGQVRPTSDIFLQISRGLQGMPDAFARNAAAVKIFGRAGIELVPTLMDLSQNVERAKALGLTVSDEELNRWLKYHQQMVEISAQWDKLYRQVAEPLAATLSVTLKVLSDGSALSNAVANMVFGGKPTAVDTEMGETGGWGYGASMSRSQHRAEAGRIKLNDSAVEAALFGTDEEQLARAKELLKKDQDSLKKGVLPSVNAATLAKIATDRQEVASIEARIKAIKDLEAQEKSLKSFEEQMYAKELGPVAAIFAKRDQFTGSLRGGATDASLVGASAALAKEVATTDKSTFELALKTGKMATEAWDEVYKTTDKAAAQILKDFTEAAKVAQQTAREIDNIQFGEQRGELIGLSGRATRLAELNAGPGQEVAAINAGYRERLGLAQQLYALDVARALRETDANKARVDFAKAEADLKREQFDADIEHELKLTELRRKNLDEYKNLVVGGFQALVSGGRGGLGAFVESQGMGIASKMVGNLAGMTYAGVAGKLTLPGQGTVDNPTWLGKMLSGTPMGLDPLKGATDMNTMATVENTQALRSLAMSPSGGGGGFSPSAGTFARLGGLFSGGQGYANDIPDSESVLAGIVDGDGAHAGSGLSLPKSLGIGGSALAGGFGIYSGIRSGGGRGALTAAGSAIAAAGSIMQLASKTLAWAGPVGMIAGMGLGMATSLFGDPKQNRAKELESERVARAYTDPTAASYSSDIYGRSMDYNYRGEMRPIVVQITATDTQSFVDALERNGAAVTSAVTSTVNAGNGDDLVGTLRQAFA
jgi:predicted nucleic acid-binding protein